jgi:hypothetical protein
LVVTANGNTPATRLQLGVEERNIRGALARGTNFSVVHESDASCVTLVERLTIEKPDILHFAGHGDGRDLEDSALRLVNEEGRLQVLSSESLARIFTNLLHPPRLVFLNSCFSANQAETLRKTSDVVMGVKGAIRDGVARSFAAIFYKILAASYSVQRAFDLAKTALDPEDRLSEQFSISPKDGVSAEDVYFLGRPELMARFVCGANGRPTLKNAHYEIEFWLRGADQHVDAVTYQFCHETYVEAGEEFWEVTRSEHRNFLLEEVTTTGDFTLRVTTWARGDGFGFEDTVGGALERHYQSDAAPHIKKAILHVKEN